MKTHHPFLTSFIVAAAVVASVASTEENTAEKVGDSPAAVEGGTSGESDGSVSASTAPPEPFVVGDVIALGDWQIVVHEVIDPVKSTNEFVEPADGFRWVGVDAEVTNLGDDPETMSSWLCFDIQDAENRSYDEAFTAESFGSIDGEVPPNGARRGTVVFEVPEAATGLRLNFQCDLFSSGTATIQL